MKTSTSVQSGCYTARIKTDLFCNIQRAVNPCGAAYRRLNTAYHVNALTAKYSRLDNQKPNHCHGTAFNALCRLHNLGNQAAHLHLCPLTDCHSGHHMPSAGNVLHCVMRVHALHLCHEMLRIIMCSLRLVMLDPVCSQQ